MATECIKISETQYDSTPSAGIGWWVFMLLAVGGFALRLAWRGGSFLNLSLYAAGREYMPYQGRILMAWILHLIADNMHFRAALTHLPQQLPPEIRDPYVFVVMAVHFFAMIAAVLAGRQALISLTGDKEFSAWASLLLIYMSYFNLVVGYGVFMMPYDVLSLAIFSIAVWLILTKRYVLLFVVVVIGELNRETAIFIPFFLACYTWSGLSTSGVDSAAKRQKWVRVAPYLLAQFVSCYLVRLWVNHYYKNSPLEGDMHNRWVIFHIFGNLLSLAKPPQWPLFLSLFGFTIPLFVAKFRMIGAYAFAMATVITMSCFLAVSMFIGVIVEIRIFNELSAFLMPCIALILWNQWVLPAKKCLPRI